MRGVPVFTLRPVVPVPALAEAGGQGRPEPPVGCEAVPGTTAAPSLLVLPAGPLLLVPPAIAGGCAALGLLCGKTVVVGGATALGLLAGPRTVGPIVPPDGAVAPGDVAVPGDVVPGDAEGAADGALAPDVPPVLPELAPPALPPDEPVCADTKPTPASRQAADNMTI
jgi:hypothetical protein